MKNAALQLASIKEKTMFDWLKKILGRKSSHHRNPIKWGDGVTLIRKGTGYWVEMPIRTNLTVSIAGVVGTYDAQFLALRDRDTNDDLDTRWKLALIIGKDGFLHLALSIAYVDILTVDRFIKLVENAPLLTGEILHAAIQLADNNPGQVTLSHLAEGQIAQIMSGAMSEITMQAYQQEVANGDHERDTAFIQRAVAGGFLPWQESFSEAGILTSEQWQAKQDREFEMIAPVLPHIDAFARYRRLNNDAVAFMQSAAVQVMTRTSIHDEAIVTCAVIAQWLKHRKPVTMTSVSVDLGQIIPSIMGMEGPGLHTMIEQALSESEEAALNEAAIWTEHHFAESMVSDDDRPVFRTTLTALNYVRTVKPVLYLVEQE